MEGSPHLRYMRNPLISDIRREVQLEEDYFPASNMLSIHQAEVIQVDLCCHYKTQTG